MHYIKDNVFRLVITKSADQPSDIGTKPCHPTTHWSHMATIQGDHPMIDQSKILLLKQRSAIVNMIKSIEDTNCILNDALYDPNTDTEVINNTMFNTNISNIGIDLKKSLLSRNISK
jgi:hypothetical protein